MKKIDNRYGEVNAMYTSLAQMAKSGDARYDAPFVHYALGELSRRYGQSIRFLMCRLIVEGMSASPTYGSIVGELRTSYEALAAGGDK